MSESQTLKALMDALEITFYSIMPYDLDYRWRISGRTLDHSVIWHLSEGEIVYALNDRAYRRKAEALMVLPAGSVISAHAVSAAVKIISINFDASLPFIRSKPWSAFIPIPENRDYDMTHIRPSIGEMLGIADSPMVAGSLLLQGHMQILFGLLLQQLHQGSAGLALNMDPRIMLVSDYLELHPEQMPDLAELSRLAQVSIPHLRRLFHQWTGLSPLQYVHHAKINLIQDRLIRTNDPIAEIAAAFGFKDANYFSRLFKKKTGLSPQSYRKKHYGI